jgi:hypothetical protein
MKKGKSVNIDLHRPIKLTYGTVDYKNLKSIYINLQSWVTPKNDFENWSRVSGNLTREIKHSVLKSINQKIFKEKSIVDLDLRTSGILEGKKSFFNLEINLFTLFELDFKSNEIKDSVINIAQNIFNENINNNRYFYFSKSKKNQSDDKVIDIGYLS